MREEFLESHARAIPHRPLLGCNILSKIATDLYRKTGKGFIYPIFEFSIYHFILCNKIDPLTIKPKSIKVASEFEVWEDFLLTRYCLSECQLANLSRYV